MRSKDGGKTRADEVDDGNLPDPRCKGTVCPICDDTTMPWRSPGIAHIGSASTNMSSGERVNITVRFSNTSGSSWDFLGPVVVLPEHDGDGNKQLGGYSCARPLYHLSGALGVVTEAQLPPDYQCGIMFARLQVFDEFPPPPVEV